MYSKPFGSVDSEDESLRPNPVCICSTVGQVLACATGHLMDCHYPQSCESARCSHWQRNQENPASVAE